jgi:hypothetical protein
MGIIGIELPAPYVRFMKVYYDLGVVVYCATTKRFTRMGVTKKAGKTLIHSSKARDACMEYEIWVCRNS